MASEGVELLAGLEELAVMGFVEVLSRLRFFRDLEARMRSILGTVDLVLPIDYPGFNLRIAAAARRAGTPVVYYIAPQVWAWKPGRARRLAQDADRIAVILPFEEEIFRREGGHSVFVGHPLLEERGEVAGRADFCSAWGFDAERPILALFPGSRAQELRRHLDPFLDAGARVVRVQPEVQLGLARAPGAELGLPQGAPVRVVDDGQGLLAHARAGIVKSGTSTLEAALAGTPFIVAYRTHPVTYALAKRLVRVEHVALANLVAGARVVPEFLQEEVDARTLADAVTPLVHETPERARMLEALGRIRARLGSPGASARVAALVEDVLVERGRWWDPSRGETASGGASEGTRRGD